MAGEASPEPLVERILSAEGPVVLLRGPAACGKTTAAVALHRHLSRPGQACLWLAPNAPAAAAVRSALLDAAPAGVLVQPMVMTFAGLVGRILSDGQSPGTLLSPFRRHLLLRSIVDELSAAGKLTALSAVADTPGLVVSLDRAIAELKRAAVEPGALAATIGRRPGKSAELAAIYRRYQQRLHTQKTYDLEGLTWLARDRLAAWPGPGLPAGLAGVRAAIADGFTDFTPTEMDLLVHLSRLLPRVVITLALDPDSRTRLWQWTGRTAETIRRTFAGRLTEVAVSREASGAPQAGLWDRVFDFDAPRCDLPPGLSVIAACGVEAEVAAVGRRVKRLLLDGAPAGSIAVLARSMDAYRPTIERVFAAYRIAIRPAGQPLTEQPIVRFVLAAAKLAPQFAYRDVLRVIRSSYFRPQALGEFDEASVAAAEAVVRCGNVVAGQDAYAHAARRLAARLQRAGEDLGEEGDGLPRVTPQQALRAAQMLEALFALARQAAQAPGGGLAMLADRLQLAAACDHDDAELLARDLRALAALEAALAELPDPAPPLAALEQALRAATCPPAASPSAVDVLGVLDARALRYRHVFCLGMTEGQFPRRFTEGALISEHDRRDWAARGLALDQRGDLVAREMLLLYLAVSRADAELTLSFLDADAAGRAAAPSSFLTSLLAPFGSLEAAQAAKVVQRIGPGQFLPRCEHLASDREAVTAAVAGLFDRDYDPRGAALAWATAHAPQRLAAAAAGLLARHRRWRRGPCDAYDGRISDDDLLRHLAERFGDPAVFSASQLNTYGTCPWAFFASYVLDLQPPAVPADRLTPLDRGLFCHRVLFTVFAHLRDELGEGFRLAGADRRRLLELLDEAIAQESARLEARGVAYPTLLRVQRQQMRDDLAEYLMDQLDRTAQLEAQCLHFELPFGLGERPAGTADPAGIPHPVRIQTPAGAILLRGKIDRIDHVRFEDLAGLLVIDYKTGRLPSKSDIDAGRDLQLALYAAACDELLGQASLGGAFHQIGGDGKQNALAAFKAHGQGFRKDNQFDQRRRDVFQRVGQFVQAIRTGRFDVLPSDECPSYCPFKQICHYAAPRAPLKAADEGEAS